jgi:hypothetical protein
MLAKLGPPFNPIENSVCEKEYREAPANNNVIIIFFINELVFENTLIKDSALK